VRITFLLTNAYGGGGTIRTTLTMASALAARHDVEVVSVMQHRDEPLLPLDSRVRLRPLIDNTPLTAALRKTSLTPVGQTKSLLHTLLSRVPSRLAHRQDVRYRVFSARSDLALIRFMRSLSGGVVIGTRPALNLILARHAPSDVIAVGQEHMHLARNSPKLQESFRQQYPRLDAVTTLTEGDARAYRELLGPGVRVEAVPNAIPDLDGLRAAHDPQTKVVVAAGRLVKQKGFDRLITAFAQVHRKHPDWTLDIYGAGQAAVALQNRIDGKGLAGVVRLPGFSRELQYRFAESAIYVMSSRFEGFPLGMLEAMKCGLPLVSFDCPTGPADIVTDGENGFLVPDGDVRGLTAAINRLIENPELRRQMGAVGAQRAEQFAADRIAVRWEQLFEELALAPRRRPGGPGTAWAGLTGGMTWSGVGHRHEHQ